MVILRTKCVIAGEASVGKSALVQTFCSDGSQFQKNYSMTMGVDLHTKAVNIPETNDSVEFYLYDSSGKEIFSDLVQASVLNIHMGLLCLLPQCVGKQKQSAYVPMWDSLSMLMVVYDVTNEQSFKACGKWLEKCQKKMNAASIIGILVANKIDLKQRRVVTMKQGREFAESQGLEYVETSAKQNENVEAAFYYLANSYHKLYQDKVEVMQSLV